MVINQYYNKTKSTPWDSFDCIIDLNLRCFQDHQIDYYWYLGFRLKGLKARFRTLAGQLRNRRSLCFLSPCSFSIGAQLAMDYLWIGLSMDPRWRCRQRLQTKGLQSLRFGRISSDFSCWISSRKYLSRHPWRRRNLDSLLPSIWVRPYSIGSVNRKSLRWLCKSLLGICTLALF